MLCIREWTFYHYNVPMPQQKGFPSVPCSGENTFKVVHPIIQRPFYCFQSSSKTLSDTNSSKDLYEQNDINGAKV